MGSTFLLDPGDVGYSPAATSFEVTTDHSQLQQAPTAIGPSRRGFAAMDPEKQREIARQGGRASHQLGTAHEWTSDEAAAAGRKGGQTGHSRKPGAGGP